MTRSLDVLMCVDRGFTLPLAVAIASIERAAVRPVVVHVIHDGLPAASRARVVEGLSQVRVHWITADDALVQGAHHSEFLSRASLFRLLAAELLPAEVERVLYLDADTVVQDPLDELAAFDLGGCTLGAVREAQSPWAGGALGPPWRELGMDPASPYFNSGVLLIDLPRWRAAEVGRRGLEVLRHATPRWGDQDALNTVLEADWAELPRRWNVQSADVRGESTAWALWRDEIEAAVRAPAVIHYTERDKPWNPGSAHPLAPVWFAHLDRTHWSGWRPRAARRGALVAAALGPVRALRAIMSRPAALPG